MKQRRANAGKSDLSYLKHSAINKCAKALIGKFRAHFRGAKIAIVDANSGDGYGLKIYMKTNLGIVNRIVELPFDAPVGDLFDQSAPDVFHYLGNGRKAVA